MKNILRDICSYIDLLKENGIIISFSCIDSTFRECKEVLPENSYLQNILCTEISEGSRNTPDFSEEQRTDKGRSVPDFAVYENDTEKYIFPVRYNGKRIICINAAVYKYSIPRNDGKRCNNFQSSAGRTEMTGCENYTGTDCDGRLKTVITPLKYMLISLYPECIKSKKVLSREEEVYNRAIQFICNNCNSDIDCEDVARSLNFSSSYMRKVFKNIENKPIGAKINEIRLKKAEKMLENTDYNITQISYFCGFNDSNYFSTVFKNKFGVSPNKYRRMHLN